MKALEQKTARLTKEQEIAGLRSNNRVAQKNLYDRLSPQMIGVCRRYVRNDQDAEDIMINGFFKVFSKIQQFDGSGPLEGWIRRIMVNESLMFLRKYNMNLSVELNEELVADSHEADRDLREANILKLLDLLPVGYRTIFNLYVIEGFKHKEIAEKLQISINTSKSQLIKARKKLQQLLSNEDLEVA